MHPRPPPPPRAKSVSCARLRIARAILHLEPSYAKMLATPLVDYIESNEITRVHLQGDLAQHPLILEQQSSRCHLHESLRGFRLF